MFPGANAPKVSCVTLLSGPVGVMSVSPVAREATTTSRKVMRTARTPIHQWMWKKWWPIQIDAAPSTA